MFDLDMAKRRKKKQRWSDLSPRRRRAIVALGAVQVTMQVAALVDLKRRPAEQVKGDKRMWAALTFINFVGAAAYFVFGRTRSPR